MNAAAVTTAWRSDECWATQWRPAAMVHGNGVDHRLLLPLDPCFAEDGRWERIYLDLPGFGRTPALEQPDAVAALLRGWARQVLARHG